MKAKKSQKELIKELNQLIEQFPYAKIMMMVDNEYTEAIADYQYTMHHIKDIIYANVLETKERAIYLSLQDYIETNEGMENITEDYSIYPAIVIITEADV